MKNFFQTIFSGSGNVVINGSSYSGSNITINGDQIVVDGQIVGEGITKMPKLDITIHGDVKELQTTSGNVQVEGNSESVSTTSGDISIGGNGGKVSTTSGNVTVVSGSIYGNVSSTSGDIKAGLIEGDAKTVSGDISGKARK